MRDTAGSAAAPAARCRNCRRGSFTALPLKLGKRATSFRLDVRRLDDRPPLLDLGLLLGGERLWRLVLVRPDSLAQVSEPLAYRRIGQGLHDGDMKAGDDILRCAFGRP